MAATLIITADDFGYHPRYDAGILEAVAAGAVDAVSVMVERVDSLPDELAGAGVALGLHLEAPAGIDPGRGEVEAQSLRLERLAGRPPDYIDGHHHCHARTGTAEAVAGFAADAGLAVRSVDAEHRGLLRAAGVRTPDRLIGRYAESEPVLPAELGSLPDGWTEWMVHPGHSAGTGASDYDAGREEDLRALLGFELPPGVTRSDQRSLPG